MAEMLQPATFAASSSRAAVFRGRREGYPQVVLRRWTKRLLLPAVEVPKKRKGRVTVFCGASDGTRKEYKEQAREMGKIIGEHGYQMLYGGGRCGVMGAVSEGAFQSSGGDVVGIMPQFLRPTEGCEKSFGTDITVDTMHERMQLLVTGAKAFIALPGGYGTLAELLEVITAKQLGVVDGDVRIAVLNTNGFYDPLLDFFKHAGEAGFLRLKGGIDIISAATPTELWERLALP